MTQVDKRDQPEKRKSVATLLTLLEFRTIRAFAAKNNWINSQSAAVRHFMRHGGFDDAVRQQHAEEIAVNETP